MASSKSLRDALPPIYRPLLPAAFDGEAVHESRATCASCQMCDHGNAPPELSASFFRPDTKCCTYHPSLPNYLVGAVLADPSPEMEEGRRRIRAQIARRIGVFPQRLGPSKKWTMLYKASSKSSFGRSLHLLCPYLDEQERCSIWTHREGVCATYYCKFDNGLAGSNFWRSLKQYLAVPEELLSVWAAKAVEPKIVDPRFADPSTELSLAELEDRAPDDEHYGSYWGAWAGREEEFYIACFERVRGLTREQYERMIDKTASGSDRLQKLTTALARVREAPHLPERVHLNRKLRVLPTSAGVVITMPYNSFDSVQIEPALYDVLKEFTHAETVQETRARLAAEQGIELEDALLSMFAMHEVLVAPPKEGVCDAGAPRAELGGRRCPPQKTAKVSL
jgi:hypothetical protein